MRDAAPCATYLSIIFKIFFENEEQYKPQPTQLQFSFRGIRQFKSRQLRHRCLRNSSRWKGRQYSKSKEKPSQRGHLFLRNSKKRKRRQHSEPKRLWEQLRHRLMWNSSRWKKRQRPEPKRKCVLKQSSSVCFNPCICTSRLRAVIFNRPRQRINQKQRGDRK